MAVIGEKHVFRLEKLPFAFEVEVEAKPGKPGEFNIAGNQECDQTFRHPHELTEWDGRVSERECDGECEKWNRHCKGCRTGR